ncbi:rRNA maturation RNAse YbeY [Mycoplasma sp. ATU-Cv-508]|uniref:rRNA maturation RNAse YbeY n=1 Tax=Mycoplasma sp. ATU-Cv-508 TaxID=2048001 RepID=UPI000FDF3581
MISLTIVNQSGRPFLRRSLLQKIAQQVGQKVLKNAQVEVSAIIIGDKQSQALNQTYRQKNQVSDVLAFPSEIEKVASIFRSWSLAIFISTGVKLLDKRERMVTRLGASEVTFLPTDCFIFAATIIRAQPKKNKCTT